MRIIPSTMWDLWTQGGPLIGEDGAPHGRVTVESDSEDLCLHKSTSSVVGTFQKGPIRWFQREDNSQTEVEVPNVTNITTDRSLDQDAATCKITLSNQWMIVNGDLALNDGELGQPGYFTSTRGDSMDAEPHWGQSTNAWNGVLVPNALIRTYQGYGGRDLTVDEALVAGNIILTGTWLIDTVQTGTDGNIQLECRDMGKLLIEQQLYPPLIPTTHYPLTYCRWVFRKLSGDASGTFIPPSLFTPDTTPLIIGAATDYVGAMPEPTLPDYIGNLPGNGYWVLSTNGETYNFGNNAPLGNIPATWGDQFNEAQDIESTRAGTGYWLLNRNGTVTAHGAAVHYGQAMAPGGGGQVYVWTGGYKSAIAGTSTGLGYWVLAFNGVVSNFGDAAAGGDHSPIELYFPNWIDSEIGIDIAGHPTANGYWTMSNTGRVQAHGAAAHYGEPYPAPGDNPGTHVITFEKITPTPTGNGYWCMDQAGQVWAYGDAVFKGGLRYNASLKRSEGMFVNWPLTDFPDFAVDLVSTPSGNGYWIFGNAGGVFPFGDAQYLGGLDRAYEVFLREDGNYKDYSDIIKELLLWSGWWLQGDITDTGAPGVYGNIETTGAFSPECIPDDVLDKQPVINAINTIKEIVAYLFFIDEEGAAHFESPNIWSAGNFLEDGTHTTYLPEIDERFQITNYGVSVSDRTVRSEIILSSSDPTQALNDTVTTRFVPQNVGLLRGIQRPAVWVNEVFTSKAEQETMAELLALFTWLAQRQGSVQCLANPAIQINDQVRIWERITSETYIHYVRGISTDMDLKSGTYTMQLTTHWMGDGITWAVDVSGATDFSFQDMHG